MILAIHDVEEEQGEERTADTVTHTVDITVLYKISYVTVTEKCTARVPTIH